MQSYLARPIVLVFLLGAGCISQPRTTSLRLTGNMTDAVVTIDDQIVGPVKLVEKRGVALPPGRHRLSVEKPGYFPHDQLIQVKEGDPPIQINIEMEPVPD